MVDILVLIALAGGMFSFSVIVEVLEKLGGSDSPTWSVLKLMGPQAWSPTNGDPVRITAALAILVFSLLYFASCCILDKAATKKNAYLLLPWIMCEGSTIVYQVSAAFNVMDRFTKIEESLLILDTLVGFAAIGYVVLTAISWLHRESSKRSPHVSRDDAEARILHTSEAPGTVEGEPLLKARKQKRLCVSKVEHKPWKQEENSLLQNMAVIEKTGDKRVRFQTAESSPTKQRKVSQKTLDKEDLPSADTGHSKGTAVGHCEAGDWMVKYVKQSGTEPKTVFGFTGQAANGTIHSIAADGNQSNHKCAATGCDYWPCNEKTFPTESGDLQLESSTPSPTDKMFCDIGNYYRGQENIYDLPEYTEETTKNDFQSNIYASITEIKGDQYGSGVSTPEIRKFTPSGDRKLPDVCKSIVAYTEAETERDSFVTTDSFVWNRNGNCRCLDDSLDLEGSAGIRGVMCQAVTGRFSPARVGPPGSSSEGNIWIWATPESTKRLMLGGGKSSGYRYYLSDTDLVVFGPKGCAYQSYSASTSTSLGDSVGQVWQRIPPPGTDLKDSKSWNGSLTDVGPNQFVQWFPPLQCASLKSQSGSSLSQTTSEFMEDYTERQASLAEHSLAVHTGASADRIYEAGNEIVCHERGRDSLKQKFKKVRASDPGVDTSEEDLVHHARGVDQSFPRTNLKRSEYWFPEGAGSRIFTHAVNRPSDIVTNTDTNEPTFTDTRTVYH